MAVFYQSYAVELWASEAYYNLELIDVDAAPPNSTPEIDLISIPKVTFDAGSLKSTE